MPIPDAGRLLDKTTSCNNGVFATSRAATRLYRNSEHHRPGQCPRFQVDVGDTIHFDHDKYAVRGSEATILERQAEWLNRYASVDVSIEGHCDERGTRAYNLALGARRAEAVKTI
ncbi:MAG TPA: OmpA family protein [Rhizomicrobium sp.]|nr:OmpA family protein [Rhizomicrobium sp.]